MIKAKIVIENLAYISKMDTALVEGLTMGTYKDKLLFFVYPQNILITMKMKRYTLKNHIAYNLHKYDALILLQAIRRYHKVKIQVIEEADFVNIAVKIHNTGYTEYLLDAEKITRKSIDKLLNAKKKILSNTNNVKIERIMN